MLKRNTTKEKKDKEKEKIGNEEKTNDATFNEGDGAKDDVSINLEKEKLLALYQTLKDLGINSIGDLEVKISRL